MLTRDEILTTLREAKPTLDSFGVGRLWLFGSFARRTRSSVNVASVRSPLARNAKTEKPYTTIRKVFERALERAKIDTGDVTVHMLRHTALSRMIEHGLDDYTVMSISGHSSTRMRERYTPPTLERRIAALNTFDLSTICPQTRYSTKRQRKLPLLFEILVDGRRLELPTSALRTRRSPN